MDIPADVTTLGSIAALIAQTLQGQGYDPAPLFAAADISMEDSSNPNALIATIKMQQSHHAGTGQHHRTVARWPA